MLAILGASAATLAVASCSSVPDWANPVSWYDSVAGDSRSKPAASPEARPVADTSRPQAEAVTPNLASVPNRPAPTADNSERRTIEASLIADRERARYTDEEVRAQPSSAPAPPRPIQAAAPAPGAPAAPSGGVPAAAPRAPVVAAAAPPPAPPAPQAPPAPAAAAPVAAPAPLPPARPAQMVQAAPSQTLAPAPAPAPMTAPPPAPAPVPPGSTALVQQTYQQALQASASTVTTATTGMGMAAAPAAPSGAGYMPPPPVGNGIAAPVGMPARAFAGPQKAVVYFPSGSASLDASDRRELRRIADQYKLGGGRVRVIGHASSRTKELPVERHKWVNFSLSMQRAEAVARELMRLGVSPGAVQVEARSDSEPVFFEAMPSGEKQNRRAEIFLEN